jgi:transcriptional regulator of acetoin/glycerol metabolism
MAAKSEKPIFEVAPAALAALVEYEFPGNVRELENIIERAFVHCRGPRIELEHLPDEVVRAPTCADDAPASQPDPVPASADVGPAPDRGEAAALLAVLQAHRWNRGHTARALGIGRNTLWRKMKRLGLVGRA